MNTNGIHFENSDVYLKQKAERALYDAKQLEMLQLMQGKKFVQLNNKTVVLR
jgi:hypothetical protein